MSNSKDKKELTEAQLKAIAGGHGPGQGSSTSPSSSYSARKPGPVIHHTSSSHTSSSHTGGKL